MVMQIKATLLLLLLLLLRTKLLIQFFTQHFRNTVRVNQFVYLRIFLCHTPRTVPLSLISYSRKRKEITKQTEN